jgi:hypothetical protein
MSMRMTMRRRRRRRRTIAKDPCLCESHRCHPPL